MRRWYLFLTIPSLLFSQPSPVLILAPSDSSVGVINPVQFSWTKSPLANSYTIQVSTSITFSSTIMNQSTPDTSFSTSSLQLSTRYYWRVRAEDTVSGASAWTNAMFTTKLKVPTLQNPITGSLDVNLRPTLSWSSVFSSARYLLQLSTLSDFSTISRSFDTSSTLLWMDSLTRATTYYWRVCAYIKGDTTAYSSSNFFSTIPNLPTAPKLLFPADSSTHNAINVRFKWQNISEATSYRLQIGTSAEFTSIGIDTSITDTIFIPQPILSINTQYFWHVKSINSLGAGNYSGAFIFTTGTDTIQAKLFVHNLNIGSVGVGGSKDTSITITNSGTDDLIISKINNQIWTAVNNGLPISTWSAPDYFPIGTITCSGTNLYAGTFGVFQSTNDGDSWNGINSGLPVTSLLLPQITGIIADGSNLYIGTYLNGVFRSTNNGISWNATSSLTSSSHVTYLTVNCMYSMPNGTGGINLFAGNSGGVFLSTNGGDKWTDVNSDLPASVQVNTFGANGSSLFIGVSGAVFGAYRSTNNGGNWTDVNTGLPANGVLAFTSIPDGSGGTILFAGQSGGVYRSTNNGASWTACGLTGTTVNVLTSIGSNIFAGTNFGIFVSTNQGGFWSGITGGISDSVFQSFAVNGSKIYVGTGSGGVFRSNYFHFYASTPLAKIAPGTSVTIFVHLYDFPPGNFSGKLIVTSNTFTSPDTIAISGFGLSYGMSLSSRKINIGRVRVGQSKDSVITITNTGNDNLVISKISSTKGSFTIRPSSFTIPAGAVEKDTIRFSPEKPGADSALIMITSNAYSSPDVIWVSATGLLTGVTESDLLPKVYTLYQNYPNPFNPSTTIRYALPYRSRVKIQIFNTLGQIVSEIIDNEQPAGYQLVNWNSSVASGIYFYRMEAVDLINPNNRFVDTKKMILIR